MRLNNSKSSNPSVTKLQNGLQIDVPGSKTLIVSFAGHDKNYYGIPRFEFVNILEKYFPELSRYFYVDPLLQCYLKGIPGISQNIEETVQYLQPIVRKYEHVVFLGTSSGGYAATLLGSLLKVNVVVAFTPVTLLRQVLEQELEKWRDISLYIKDSTTYYIFGDESVKDPMHYHHISHCERLQEVATTNVHLARLNIVDLKQFRDNGFLYRVLWHAIHPSVKTDLIGKEESVTETPTGNNESA